MPKNKNIKIYWPYISTVTITTIAQNVRLHVDPMTTLSLLFNLHIIYVKEQSNRVAIVRANDIFKFIDVANDKIAQNTPTHQFV